MLISAALMVLISATGVRADMTGGAWPEPAGPMPAAQQPPLTPALSPGHPQTSGVDRWDSFEAGLNSALPEAPSVDTGPSVGGSSSGITVLPAGPGSVSLFFAAMGGLGAWQLGRSARRIRFGPVPEWYHTGGPPQVGHAVPLDLTSSVVPVFHLDRPAWEPPVLWRFVGRIPVPACTSHDRLFASTPRAPPLA